MVASPGALDAALVARVSVGHGIDAELGPVIGYEEYHRYGTTAWHAEDSSLTARKKRYRYTGKERDAWTQLAYHGARYYLAWLGRWESADPAGMVDGPNRYAYVSGNPVSGRDPSGMAEVGTLVEDDDLGVGDVVTDRGSPPDLQDLARGGLARSDTESVQARANALYPGPTSRMGDFTIITGGPDRPTSLETILTQGSVSGLDAASEDILKELGDAFPGQRASGEVGILVLTLSDGSVDAGQRFLSQGGRRNLSHPQFDHST